MQRDQPPNGTQKPIVPIVPAHGLCTRHFFDHGRECIIQNHRQILSDLFNARGQPLTLVSLQAAQLIDIEPHAPGKPKGRLCGLTGIIKGRVNRGAFSVQCLGGLARRHPIDQHRQTPRRGHRLDGGVLADQARLQQVVKQTLGQQLALRGELPCRQLLATELNQQRLCAHGEPAVALPTGNPSASRAA